MQSAITTNIFNAYNVALSTREFTDNGSRMQFHLESVRRICTAIINDDNQEAGVKSNCTAVVQKINHVLRNDMDDQAVNFYAPAISWVYQTVSRELWHVKGLGTDCFKLTQQMMQHGICPMIANA